MKESLKILQHESVNAMQLTHRTMFSGCCAAAETDSSDRGSNLRRLTEGKSPVSSLSCSCSCCCGAGGGRGRPGGGCHLPFFRLAGPQPSRLMPMCDMAKMELLF